MDLLKAAQSGSLKDVEEAVKSQGIWTDYEALNTALANGNIEIATFLLSQNCRVNKTIAADKFESTPLHKAVELKDVDLVKLLLESKASITAVTEGGNTPLHLAFIAGLFGIVNVLLDYISEGSKIVNCKNDFGLSHLHIACTTENSKVIEKYLNAYINIEDAVNDDSPKWAGYTAYHFATKYRSLPAICTLSNSQLQRQSVQKDKDGQTPRDLVCAQLVEHSIIAHVMSDAFQSGKRSYYFQSQSGVQKCKDVDQPTAFHLACMRGDSHLVKAFLERGAPVNIPVSKEMKICPLYSPLHFAVESGCQKTVKLLLEYGADLSQTNGYKMTALHLAMYNEERWRISRVVDLLYSKVENKEENPKDANGLGYFHIAVSKNDVELVRKMLNGKQVDVNSQVSANDRGFSLYTPFHFAVQYGDKEMVKLLAELGADVNVVSSRGTAVQLASEYTPIEAAYDTLELLVSVGAKADVVVGKKTLLHRIVLEVIYNNSWNMDPTTIHHSDSRELLDYIGQVIELGCDVDAKDEYGDTALHIASNSSIACVRRLLQGGADVNVENNKGQCVGLLHAAASMHRRPQNSVVCHHVQNLKALGWRINPKLEKKCEELLTDWGKTKRRKEEDTDDEDSSYDEDDMHNAYGNRWQRHRSPTPTEDYAYDEDMYNVYDRRSWLALTQIHRPNEIKEMKSVKLDKKTTLYDFMRLDGENLGVHANNEVLKGIVEGKSSRFSVYGYLIKIQYRKSQKYAGAKTTRKRCLKNDDGEENLSKRKRAK